MTRWRRGAVCGVVSILALAITSCNVQWVNVMIPDFQSKQVQGVWIWRSSGATGAFSHDLQVAVPLQIVSPRVSGVQPGQWQIVPDSTGQGQLLFVMAQPDAANPDGITVKIGLVAPFTPGYVKVSTYNAAGESPVSDGETSL